MLNKVSKIKDNVPIQKFQAGMTRVPDDLIKFMKNKKYFEIKDLEVFKDCWCFFIKGKKGIGKSWSLIDLMNKVDQSDQAKMVYLRTRMEDLKMSAASFETNPRIPFTIKNKLLISKKTGRICGIAAFANNLSSLRSQNYSDYKYIVYDEYVAQNPSDYKFRDQFANKFVRFVMDVYRDFRDEKGVSPLKVYCFGNDDIEYDPFTEYFRLDVHDTYLNWDRNIGVVAGNLRNYYQGMLKESKAYGLAYYDEQMEQFLDANRSFENLTQMINYSETDGGIIEKYLFFDGKMMAMIRLIKEPDKFAFRLVHNPIKGIPIWTFELTDDIQLKNSVLLNEFQLIPFINMLANGIKYGKYKFTNSIVKEKIEELIFLNRHKKIQDLYKLK